MAYAPPRPAAVSGMYQLFATGLPLGACKKAKIPLAKIKATKMQSAGNSHETKYPSGIAEFDDLELGLFHAADGTSIDWLLQWQEECVNLKSTGAQGTGTTPEAAKRTLTVEQYDGSGNLVAAWRCIGCFPVDLGSLDHEGGKEDAVELDLKFSVDRVERAA